MFEVVNFQRLVHLIYQAGTELGLHAAELKP